MQRRMTTINNTISATFHPKRSLLDRVSRQCARHPFRVATAWLIILISVFAVQRSISSKYQNNINLPGSQSSIGIKLLKKNQPSATGYTGLVVVTGDHLTRYSHALAASETNLRRLNDIVAVGNPLAPRSPDLSSNGRTALITVTTSVFPPSLGKGYAPLLYQAMKPVTHAGLTVDYGGGFASVVNPPLHDASSESVGFGIAIVILILTFGSLIGAGLPLVVALLSVGVGVSILGIVASMITFATDAPTLALMIGLGVGIDYAVLLTTRFRQRIIDGYDPVEAAGRTAATSGQAVIIAAASVSVALLGLYASGLTFFGLLGFAAFLCVLTGAAGALTLVPAGLGLAGRHIDRFHVGRITAESGASNDLWHRYTRALQRRPIIFLAVGIAILGVLAIPFFSLRFGNVGADSYPASFSSHRAYDQVNTAFGAGANGPLVIAVNLHGFHGQIRTLVERLETHVSQVPDVAFVTPPTLTPNHDVLVTSVVPESGPNSQATQNLFNTLTNTTVPHITAGSGVHGFVTGGTALQIQFDQTLSSDLAGTIAVILITALILIAAAFRSVVLAIKAVIMNLISIGASYGVLVAVFQWGWGRSLLGMSAAVPIEAYVPLVVFAVVFGLSMDYEVFLLSRVRELWLKTGDNQRAVAEGLSSTGRVISAAALIMVSVFFAFIGSPDVVIKMFSVGFGVSVLIDATVVRLLLVPSIMTLLGTKNWWIPHWLDRILPTISTEGVEEPPAAHPPIAPTVDAIS